MAKTLNSDEFSRMLRDLGKALKLNQAQMAERFGIPQGTLSKWLSGAQQPRLFDAFPIIEAHRKLALVSPSQREPAKPNTAREIAEIDVYAGAGGGGLVHTEYDDNGAVGEVVRDHWVVPEAVIAGLLRSASKFLRAFEVVGDSMLPTLIPGDRVFVDTRRKEPNPEGVFVLWDGSAVVVKSLQIVRGSEPLKIRVISDNQKYPAYEVLAEEAQIIGRYVGRFTTS